MTTTEHLRKLVTDLVTCRITDEYPGGYDSIAHDLGIGRDTWDATCHAAADADHLRDRIVAPEQVHGDNWHGSHDDAVTAAEQLYDNLVDACVAQIRGVFGGTT